MTSAGQCQRESCSAEKRTKDATDKSKERKEHMHSNDIRVKTKGDGVGCINMNKVSHFSTEYYLNQVSLND